MENTEKNFKLINASKIKVNGAPVSPDPSDIQVSTEIIRNNERALDGTMCIDIVAKKLGLQIMWDLVTAEDFNVIKKTFPLADTVGVSADNISADSGTGIKLFSREDYQNDLNNGDTFECYVDSVNAQPCFIGETLYWQAVTVKLAEV